MFQEFVKCVAAANCKVPGSPLVNNPGVHLPLNQPSPIAATIARARPNETGSPHGAFTPSIASTSSLASQLESLQIPVPKLVSTEEEAEDANASKILISGN